METAGVGVAVIKQRGMIRCNQRLTEIFGHTSTLWCQNHAASHALGQATYPPMAQGRTYKSEVRMRHKNGTLRWTQGIGKLVNPANTDEGSIWIVDAISEPKAAQVQLESVLMEQSLILDNAMVGVVFLRKRKVTRCNKTFEAMRGYAPGELHGCSSRQCFPSKQDWLEAISRWQAPFAQEPRFEDRNDSVSKEWRPHPLRNARPDNRSSQPQPGRHLDHDGRQCSKASRE